MLWLDEYERRARLVPGLWLVAPVVVIILMFGLGASPLISTVSGLLATAGGPVVLASLVRHMGLRLEKQLLSEWEGWPTTTLLTSGPAPVLNRRREAVEAVTGHTLPPTVADDPASYDAAVSIVRSRTRDRAKFGLVFEENRNYGYERNLLGAQSLGLAISILALAGSGAASVIVANVRGSFGLELGIGLLALAALAGFWKIVPSKERSKTVAFKYAERLLEGAQDLQAPDGKRL